jgi:hypothetical protein
MRFSDPARTFYDGGIWAFGDNGRPSFLVTLERYEETWAWELIGLSKEAVSVQFLDGWTWSPRMPAFELAPMPAAAAPASTVAARLRQMKGLVRRISAFETTGTGERFELRLMPQPLLTYGSSDGTPIDGALFAFAYGTNPEVLALIEAHSTDERPLAWHYGFLPMTTAAATGQIDGKDVWAKPLSMQPKSQEPYTYLRDPLP